MRASDKIHNSQDFPIRSAYGGIEVVREVGTFSVCQFRDNYDSAKSAG